MHSLSSRTAFAICRTTVLFAFLLVATGSVLGFAVSLHLSQVYERVSTVRAAALPLGSSSRVFAIRNSL